MIRLILAFTVLVLSATLAPKALANSPTSLPTMICKDCPFPMRVGENRWRMPNGYVELEIEKQKLPNRYEKIQVRLIDTRDGKVLAEGMSTQRQGRRTVQVDMLDLLGSPVHGFVRYIGSNQREIQVRFTCDNCSIIGQIHGQTR